MPSILSREDRKRRPRQSVQFSDCEADVVFEVESCFNFPEDIRRDLWHSRDDYEFSRSSAKVVAKESERYGYSRHLDGAYLDSYDAQVQDALKTWGLHGHSRRGLERWCNRVHGRIRKDDQYMHTHGVLRAQAEMKLKEEYSHDRLREMSHCLSKKSRLFAQMMGEADSHAVQCELGLIDSAEPVSPRHVVRKNLGLSGARTVPAARSSRSAGAAAGPAVPAQAHAIRRSLTGTIRRSSDTRVATPTIRIRTKSGRVPRIA